MNRHEFMQRKTDPPKVKKKKAKKKKKSPPKRKLLGIGDSVCLTGTGSVTRADYEWELQNRGVTVTANVRRADVLVFSRTDTVKYARALESGVLAISYAQLDRVLGI